jgi:phage terminase large subunit GpA-like protein
MDVFSPAEVAAGAASLLRALALVVTPAPDQRISEWAEGRLDIPGETGTDRPGLLNWDGFEYLIEPLDRHHGDDPCRDITMKGSAQIAKTTVGIVATMYYSAVQPRPWGVALPSTEEVLKYNRTKWQPICDATPELKRKLRPVSSRDETGSSSTYKKFSGGYGQFFGAGSPKALQMISLCLVVYEETPNWNLEVGGRGDPRSQIRMRQLRWERAGAKTFHNATPGIVRAKSEETPGEREEGAAPELVGCPVTEDYLAGDQRQLYHPCPHCGDDPNGVLIRLDYDRMQGLKLGETPHFNCPECGGEIRHQHKEDMVRRCHPYRPMNCQRGGWIPTFPSKDEANPAPAWFIRAADFETWRARPLEHRQPSYFAWQIVSSAIDWDHIASEHRKAETGTEAVKTSFSQQILGQAYQLQVLQTPIELLLAKRDARLVRAVVPSGFELLTNAVDLNGDWAQWTVYGWGPEARHTIVDRGRIEGSPHDLTLWRAVEELRSRTYPHEDGGRLGLEGFGVDSGYGTFHVYSFCSRFPDAKALDGADGWGLMPLRRGSIQKLRGPDGTVVRCRTWRVGTWDLKRELLNDVIPAVLAGEASARSPWKPVWPGWLERDFFDELTAEALIERQDKKTGVMKPATWVRVRRRNEEMDLYVYNAALARSKGVGVVGAEPDWLELARRRMTGQLELDALWDRPTPTPAAPPPGAPAKPELLTANSGWGWKKRA